MYWFITNTIFGAEDSQGSVSEKELWILHSMLYGLNDQSTESRVCSGAFVAFQLMYHATARLEAL